MSEQRGMSEQGGLSEQRSMRLVAGLRRVVAVAAVLALGVAASGCTKTTELDGHPGEYVGLGVELRASAEGAEVVRVFEGGAADGAGIREGEVLTMVDGEKLAGKSLGDMTAALRGLVGTQANVTVRGATRKGDEQVVVRRMTMSVSPTGQEAYEPSAGKGK